MKIKTIAFAMLALMLVYSCEEPTNDDSGEVISNNVKETESVNSEKEHEEVLEAPQTVDERILEIKELYAKIQSSPNQEKNCNSKTKTTINYDVIEEGIPFENKAKECLLENDFKYQQVEMNGYEWSETCTFYFKENKLFFTYFSGGAEACGYDYRVYYSPDGEVIRVLLAENDCDGQEVGSSIEVTEETRKDEILNEVAIAEKEFKEILQR